MDTHQISLSLIEDTMSFASDVYLLFKFVLLIEILCMHSKSLVCRAFCLFAAPWPLIWTKFRCKDSIILQERTNSFFTLSTNSFFALASKNT